MKNINTMQKKYIQRCFQNALLSLAFLPIMANAQENVYPTAEQKGITAITHATAHLGNGTIVNDATIVFEKGKITALGTGMAAPANASIVDAKGKQVYPGLILPSSDLGLKEVGAGVRGSNDYYEIGENNANIHAIHAYNADSKIIGVLRENGILLAGIAPEGELIQGQAAVVQLNAWNFEDAAYKIDNGLYVEMPSFIVRRGGRGPRFMMGATDTDPLKQANEKLATIKQFFEEAKAYHAEKTHIANNLRFEATKGLFDGTKKLFVRANEVKQILLAIDLAKAFGFKLVIVGASESFQIASLLAQNKVEIILTSEHSLPSTEDDDVDQPYKTAAALQKAGVLFCLNDTHDQSRYRNLAFNAGTTVAYGLSKEEALSAITINAAKILGVADKTGTLEVGKDANIIISEGDVLDMRGNQLTHAFIQGRNVSLDNKQKQLYERYKFKYGIK